MKKEIIDGYEIYSENEEMKIGIFEDYNGKKHCFVLGEDLKFEFITRKREKFREENEERRHLDVSINNEYTFETRTINKEKSAELNVIDKLSVENIKNEIWKLPYPQNKRVYLYLFKEYSFVKIAKIENRDKSAIKRSVDTGIQKLRKKFTNF